MQIDLASRDVYDTIKLGFMVFGGTVLFLTLRYIYQNVLRPQWYLRHIPRPPPRHIITGNIKDLLSIPTGGIFGKWHAQYGPTFHFDALFSTARISTIDKRALQHVFLTEPYKFPKPTFIRKMLASVLGEGVIYVEGADHARQRKIMNPSFGPAHLKVIFPVFLEKAYLLRNSLLNAISTGAEKSGSTGAERTVIDIFSNASRATLDVIAAAGFGYEVNAIESGNSNELATAFNKVINSGEEFNFWRAMVGYFPFLEIIPDWSENVVATKLARAKMDKIGRELIAEKKKLAISSIGGGPKSEVQANQMAGKDLLSLLVKANMSVDLKPTQKMTDDEVMAQISTFLLAGNDTTANGISWAIYALCTEPPTQSRLRDELLAVQSDSPTYDEINALPYLDAVIRETLRVYPPVAGTTRIATEDSLLPLANPIIDSKGKVHTELFIAKNTSLLIPIVYINKNKDTWGPDADLFRPERWFELEKLPEGALEMPSLAFPTFLAGPRGCIGFRFSIIEMKALLFTLIRSMKIELAVPADDIEGVITVTTRPRVKSRPKEGWQLPVILTPFEQDI